MNARADPLINEAPAPAPHEATVAEAWADELRQRKNDLHSGVAQPVAWDEVRERLNAL
jgi:putative addiction module component (TIGR02574 family)